MSKTNGLCGVIMGYHVMPIAKGQVGELSKIQEELSELKDATAQDSKIMALVELSDLYGAIELYIEKHFPDFTMEDLKVMSNITRRVFENGER